MSGPLDPMGPPNAGLLTEGPVQGMIPLASEPPPIEGKVMEREAPEPDPRRRALVTSLTEMVRTAKTHWKKTFDQMVKDQKFAAGAQWPEETKAEAFNDDANDRYIANITLRHIQQKVAAVYAKNPRAVARRRPRLLSTVWDGTIETLKQAQGLISQAQAADMAMQQAATTAMAGGIGAAMGVPMDPMAAPGGPPGGPGAPPGAPPGLNGLPGMAPALPPPPDPVELEEAQAVVADAKAVKAETTLQNRIGRTLELLYAYEISEQQQPFKSMMKMTVRRAATSGVGWTRVGFQRIMGRNPDLDSRIADMAQRLALIERIASDMADNEIDDQSGEAEQLRMALAATAAEPEIIVREGLQLTWPKSTAIIPDPRCTNLREFLGCDWVAEEYILSPNEIKETYKVDVGKSFTSYQRSDTGKDYEQARASWQSGGKSDDAQISPGDGDCALVWEIYNKRDGLVYIVCDGHPDFLREPAAPEYYIDRFWPWFPTMFNEADGRVFPPSDVELIKPMQLELNRSRQGLREHRFANRPKTAYAEGTLDEADLDALRTHPVNALISIAGLQPGQKIEEVLQPVKGVPVDPNLYEVNPIFQDMLRAVGDQEANLGGIANATATETNIAQGSRATSMGSIVDDLDDTLSGIARAAGQILILNCSEETVKSIVGPGAVWPTLTKAEVSKNIYLEIEAGSSGRPNQAQELQNFERLAPVLMQIPGIKPAFLAKEAIRRLDDSIDVEEATSEGLASITSQNGVKPGSPMPGPGGQDPGAQGPAGANNAPGAPPPRPDAPTPIGRSPMGNEPPPPKF